MREGVVGVRLSVESSSREFRFTAVGTAISPRADHATGAARPRARAEFSRAT